MRVMVCAHTGSFPAASFHVAFTDSQPRPRISSSPRFPVNLLGSHGGFADQASRAPSGLSARNLCCFVCSSVCWWRVRRSPAPRLQPAAKRHFVASILPAHTVPLTVFLRGSAGPTWASFGLLPAVVTQLWGEGWPCIPGPPSPQPCRWGLLGISHGAGGPVGMGLPFG